MTLLRNMEDNHFLWPRLFQWGYTVFLRLQAKETGGCWERPPLCALLEKTLSYLTWVMLGLLWWW